MLVTQIWGSVSQFELHGRHVDYVHLQWFEANRRIMRKTSIDGADVAFRLFQEGFLLAHDDVVWQDEHTVLVIQIEPCDVIVCTPSNMAEMARACYEIGNKHAPLFLELDELLMPYEAPMFAWLTAAGFVPRRDVRRLSRALRSNSAQGAGRHEHGHTHHGHGDFKARVYREREAI